MNAPRTALHGQVTTITGSLYVAFELDKPRPLANALIAGSASSCTH